MIYYMFTIYFCLWAGLMCNDICGAASPSKKQEQKVAIEPNNLATIIVFNEQGSPEVQLNGKFGFTAPDLKSPTHKKYHNRQVVVSPHASVKKKEQKTLCCKGLCSLQ
jgi:hypothetical protein